MNALARREEIARGLVGRQRELDLVLAAAHRITENARHRLLHDVPRLTSAIIHADPCGHDGVDHHAELEHHDRGNAGRPEREDDH